MRPSIRISVGFVLLALGIACNGSSTSPEPQKKDPEPVVPLPPVVPPASVPVTPTTPQPPAPGVPVPPLEGPSRTFSYAGPLGYDVNDATRLSRFVLYDNGAFVLQYPGYLNESKGRYSVSGTTVNFEWNATSAAGSWTAVGQLSGNTLTVRYNAIMSASDFEDAVYERVP